MPATLLPYELNVSDDVAHMSLRGPIGVGGIFDGDGVDALQVAADVEALQAPSLRVTVNSPGGIVDAGIDVYNALRGYAERGGKLETYNSAMSASIASVIMLAGDRRITAPHSRWMIHEASIFAAVTASEAEALAKRLRDTTNNIASIYADRTGKPTSYWLPLMSAETWFSDKQAKDEGFATEIGRGHDPVNFAMASAFPILNQFKSWPGFDPEVQAEADETPSAEPIAPEDIPVNHLITLEAALALANASLAAIHESAKAKPTDPRDAARRELEAAIARVKL